MGEDKMKRFLAPLVAVMISDQLLKLYMESHLSFYQSLQIIPGLLSLHRVHNQGAAFGMLVGQNLIFIVCALVVILVGGWIASSNRCSKINLALGLIAGGALGNLIDRLRVGYVIDYIDVSFFPPVFNLADIAITLGALFLIIRLWKTEEWQ